jgi:hypothetical protein
VVPSCLACATAEAFGGRATEACEGHAQACEGHALPRMPPARHPRSPMGSVRS